MFKTSELKTAVGGNTVAPGKPGLLTGISTDTRTLERGNAFVALKGENFDGNSFIPEAVRKGAGAIIFQGELDTPSRSALRSVTAIRVSDSLEALGDIARFHRRRFDVPVIAVTGSTGKTTTKDMIACLLSPSGAVLKTEGTMNNQVGLPQTLLRLAPAHGACVLELGSNHPGEIAYLAGVCEPTMAVITNVGPSHLEYFGNLEGVRREKFSLLERLASPAIAVLCPDFYSAPVVSHLAKKKKPFIITCGMRGGVDFAGSGLSSTNRGISFSLRGKRLRLATLGAHNVYNALEAVACARVLGVSYPAIREALAGFEFPAGRLKLRRVNGVRFLDDTYNSNPASLRVALKALAGVPVAKRRIAVLGDMLELGAEKERFHREAGKEAAAVCDVLICVGKLSRFSALAALRAGLDKKNVFACLTSQEARSLLFDAVRPGPKDVVLMKASRRMQFDRIVG